LNSPEAKIGPLLKRYKEQVKDGESLKNEIAKIDTSKHRLAKLGGALIKVGPESIFKIRKNSF